MIILGLLNLILGVFQLICLPLPNIPGITENGMTSIYNIIDVIFDNMTLLPLFIRIDTIIEIATVWVIVEAVKHGYHIIMWVIHKIPLSID